MVADEGSVGWSLFLFLASPQCSLRVMWHPDPPHQLSNMYNNGMAAQRAMAAARLNLLVVHKYRRAPFAQGKFWRQARRP